MGLPLPQPLNVVRASENALLESLLLFDSTWWHVRQGIEALEQISEMKSQIPEHGLETSVEWRDHAILQDVSFNDMIMLKLKEWCSNVSQLTHGNQQSCNLAGESNLKYPTSSPECYG
jgi:hypothetical protein